MVSYIPAEANTCRTAWLVPVSKPKVWIKAPPLLSKPHTACDQFFQALFLFFCRGGAWVWGYDSSIPNSLQVSDEPHYHPFQCYAFNVFNQSLVIKYSCRALLQCRFCKVETAPQNLKLCQLNHFCKNSQSKIVEMTSCSLSPLPRFPLLTVWTSGGE